MKIMQELQLDPDNIRVILLKSDMHQAKVNKIDEQILIPAKKNGQSFYICTDDNKFIVVRHENEVAVASCNRYTRRIKRPAVLQRRKGITINAVDSYQKADEFVFSKGVAICFGYFLTALGHEKD